MEAAEGWACAGGDANSVDSPASDCPSGLETKFTGAKSNAQCFTQAGYGRKTTRNTATGVVSYTVAPAGSYLDKGTGKKCPKGTYTTGLNQLSVCNPCGDGVTTAAEGSTSVDACDRAVPGYKYTGSNTAEKCDLDTFNPTESTSSTCTPCPFNMKTRDTGSKGASDCLAPPGWAQATATANITECPTDTYKEGWNRNPCLSCGSNVVTLETGTVSKDGCLVPPGYGLTQLSPSLSASP
eukprot:gene3536-3805_t